MSQPIQQREREVKREWSIAMVHPNTYTVLVADSSSTSSSRTVSMHRISTRLDFLRSTVICLNTLLYTHITTQHAASTLAMNAYCVPATQAVLPSPTDLLCVDECSSKVVAEHHTRQRRLVVAEHAHLANTHVTPALGALCVCTPTEDLALCLFTHMPQ